jgi:hypothetical protein
MNVHKGSHSHRLWLAYAGKQGEKGGGGLCVERVGECLFLPRFQFDAMLRMSLQRTGFPLVVGLNVLGVELFFLFDGGERSPGGWCAERREIGLPVWRKWKGRMNGSQAETQN